MAYGIRFSVSDADGGRFIGRSTGMDDLIGVTAVEKLLAIVGCGGGNTVQLFQQFVNVLLDGRPGRGGLGV